MLITLHKNATTTPAKRLALQQASGEVLHISCDLFERSDAAVKTNLARQPVTNRVKHPL